MHLQHCLILYEYRLFLYQSKPSFIQKVLTNKDDIRPVIN